MVKHWKLLVLLVAMVYDQQLMVVVHQAVKEAIVLVIEYFLLRILLSQLKDIDPNGDDEELYTQWKQAIVAFAKPVLRGPFERSEITKDEFKQILKKTADKVISSYRKEGVPPPANFEIVGNQRAKIQKLVEDYVSFIQKRDE